MLVGKIPVDSAAEPVLEGGFSAEGEFACELVGANGVPPIVARPIFDEGYEFAGAAAAGCAANGSIPGLTYRSQTWSSDWIGAPTWHASGSYVTGAHNMKFGYQGAFYVDDQQNFTNAYNLAYPTGVARIGSREYPVSLNNSPLTAAAFNNIPLKVVNGATV